MELRQIKHPKTPADQLNKQRKTIGRKLRVNEDMSQKTSCGSFSSRIEYRVHSRASCDKEYLFPFMGKHVSQQHK